MATGLMVSVAVVEPVMPEPSESADAPLYHWYVNPVPLAVTLNTALPPVHLISDVGWLLIETTWLTVKTAAVEVTALQGANPLISTVYEPASVTDTFDNVYVEEVAPVIFVPFFLH